MPDNYRRNEIQRVLDAGPNDDEDFFRLEVHGTKSTKRLSLSAAELSTIRDLLFGADNPEPWLLALDRIEEVLVQMSEDDRNDAIEALRSRFDEQLYTRP